MSLREQFAKITTADLRDSPTDITREKLKVAQRMEEFIACTLSLQLLHNSIDPLRFIIACDYCDLLARYGSNIRYELVCKSRDMLQGRGDLTKEEMEELLRSALKCKVDIDQFVAEDDIKETLRKLSADITDPALQSAMNNLITVAEKVEEGKVTPSTLQELRTVVDEAVSSLKGKINEVGPDLNVQLRQWLSGIFHTLTHDKVEFKYLDNIKSSMNDPQVRPELAKIARGVIGIADKIMSTGCNDLDLVVLTAYKEEFDNLRE